MNKTIKYVASSVAVIVIAAVTYLTGSYLSGPKDMVNNATPSRLRALIYTCSIRWR